MRIVIVGVTGHIGPGLVAALRADGQEALAAVPGTCFDALTGEGLGLLLRGADVVIDLADASSINDESGLERFVTSARTLLDHEAVAGVMHHVALTPTGVERALDSSHFRARLAQEQLIRHLTISYSIVRSAPLFEGLETIAALSTHGSTVRIPPILVDPVASDDVVRLLASTAVGRPLDGAIEIGGPEPFYLHALVERYLGATNDTRTVIGDSHARYFGAEVSERSLVSGTEAELGAIRFDQWLLQRTSRSSAPEAATFVPASGAERAFRLSDVPPGSVLLMGDVAVFGVAGGLCATQAMCTHRAGPLSEGVVDDTTVTCPLHGAQFNVWTGAVLRGPATQPLTTYRVIVEGDIGRVVSDEPRAAAAR